MRLEALAVEVLGHLLCELDGHHCHEDPLVDLDALADLILEVLHLPGRGSDFDARVEQPSGPDLHPSNSLYLAQQPLHHHPLTWLVPLSCPSPAAALDVQQPLWHSLSGNLSQMAQLALTGGCADVHHLRHQFLELVDAQRAVVVGRGQSEAVVDEVLLAREVTAVHACHLRQGDVRLVHDDEVPLLPSVVLLRAHREEVEQAVRALAALPAVEMHRVVLDALARADLVEHLEVESGALFLPVRFQFHLLGVEPLQPVIELRLDILERLVEALFTGHVELARVNPSLLEVVERLPRDRLADLYALYPVPSEADAQRVVAARHPDVQHLSAQPDVAARNLPGSAAVLQADQLPDDVLRVGLVSHSQPQVVLLEHLGGVQSVDD